MLDKQLLQGKQAMFSSLLVKKMEKFSASVQKVLFINNTLINVMNVLKVVPYVNLLKIAIVVNKNSFYKIMFVNSVQLVAQPAKMLIIVRTVIIKVISLTMIILASAKQDFTFKKILVTNVQLVVIFA